MLFRSPPSASARVFACTHDTELAQRMCGQHLMESVEMMLYSWDDFVKETNRYAERVRNAGGCGGFSTGCDAVGVVISGVGESGRALEDLTCYLKNALSAESGDE